MNFSVVDRRRDYLAAYLLHLAEQEMNKYQALGAGDRSGDERIEAHTSSERRSGRGQDEFLVRQQDSTRVAYDFLWTRIGTVVYFLSKLESLELTSQGLDVQLSGISRLSISVQLG